MQEVVELSFGLKKLSSATYVTRKWGITFSRTLLFITTERVNTDKLLVSHEAVRVLDRRE